MPLLPSTTPNLTALKIGEYKIVVVDAEAGTSQDLSELVTSIQWDYDLDQPSEHYQISFVHASGLASRVKPGDRIKVYGYAIRPLASSVEMYWELLKRVYISSTQMGSEQGGELKATGYNVMWFLTRNKDSVMLLDETASQFITRTAAYYGIPLGTIMETGVVLQREPFVNRTIWDMWVTALSYTRDINPDARFLLQEKDGKVELIARTPPGSIWEFQRGIFKPGPDSWSDNIGNIFSASNTFSMDNYINVVRVYKGGATTDIWGTASSSPSLLYQIPSQAAIEAGADLDVNRYGMFLDSVDLQMPGEEALNLGSDQANAEQQAKKLYDKGRKIANIGTITSFNINTMRPGDPVHVREEITGMVGKYFVKSGSHVITDNEASMTLTCNIEDALPEAYTAQRQRKSTNLFGNSGSFPSDFSTETAAPQ